MLVSNRRRHRLDFVRMIGYIGIETVTELLVRQNLADDAVNYGQMGLLPDGILLMVGYEE